METSSISDFYGFSLYIFDLDNTIYQEEDYLFQGYHAIAEYFALKDSSLDATDLFLILKNIYQEEGREKLFNKFLETIDTDHSHIPICLKILRTFNPAEKLHINSIVKTFILDLITRGKIIFVLTNGNTLQQKNKIKNINWDGLDKSIQFVLANEFEPKPSPAGVEHILNISGVKKTKTLFIGDSEIDKLCAINSGITFLNVKNLSNIG